MTKQIVERPLAGMKPDRGEMAARLGDKTEADREEIRANKEITGKMDVG